MTHRICTSHNKMKRLKYICYFYFIRMSDPAPPSTPHTHTHTPFAIYHFTNSLYICSVSMYIYISVSCVVPSALAISLCVTRDHIIRCRSPQGWSGGADPIRSSSSSSATSFAPIWPQWWTYYYMPTRNCTAKHVKAGGSTWQCVCDDIAQPGRNAHRRRGHNGQGVARIGLLRGMPNDGLLLSIVLDQFVCHISIAVLWVTNTTTHTIIYS